jgi:FKBP-type peptidyl-prolyl cis-trans isomerase SlyD
MQIGPGKAVTISYTLKDDAGTVLEATEGGAPLSYLVGGGRLVAGLEKALAGRRVGERLAVSLSADDGYGARDEGRVHTIPIRQLQVEDKSTVAVGGRYRAWLQDGAHLVVVRERRDKEVVVDGNHPLAGKTLHFAVEVIAIRDATAAELSHGHVHGPDSDH